MEKILNLAPETFHHLEQVAQGETAEKIKANVSAIVHEAESLSNAYALAVASGPKSVATSPAPKPADAVETKPDAATAPSVFIHPIYGTPVK